MQPENIITEEKHALCRVTSLSKYLAMFLLVILPFVGGFVGYSLEKSNNPAVDVTLNTPVPDTVSREVGIPNMVLLSEKTTLDEYSDVGVESRIDIYHRETIAVKPLPDSKDYIKFDIGSFQYLHEGDINWRENRESNVFASRLDFNQHLKFNEQKSLWYVDGVDGYSSTTLFRVHRLEPQEGVIAKLNALFKVTSLEEYERSVLTNLAQQFPAMDESFFLNRDFCETVEKYDGVTGYIYDVKPEYRQAVVASGEHFALFCHRPTVLKIGDVLVENYAVPIDATEPKAFNFQPVQSEELLAI